MKLKVFVVAFLLFLGITLAVYPNLPPGEMLFTLLSDLFGFPDATYSILGFSAGAISSGIINGLSWGALVLIIFSLGKLTSARKVGKVTVPTLAPPPTPTLIAALKSSKQPMIRTPSNSRKIKTYVSLDKDIEVINGIGPKYGNMLRSYGINNLEGLLKEGATWKGRWKLADHVGVANHKIFTWVNQADFFRIEGVGRQYAGLLDAAGVNTVMDLSKRKADSLYNTLRETNWEKKLVKRTPHFAMIENWIQNATQLEWLIEQ